MLSPLQMYCPASDVCTGSMVNVPSSDTDIRPWSWFGNINVCNRMQHQRHHRVALHTDCVSINQSISTVSKLIQVCVQLPTYVDNAALPAFARCCCINEKLLPQLFPGSILLPAVNVVGVNAPNRHHVTMTMPVVVVDSCHTCRPLVL